MIVVLTSNFSHPYIYATSYFYDFFTSANTTVAQIDEVCAVEPQANSFSLTKFKNLVNGICTCLIAKDSHEPTRRVCCLMESLSGSIPTDIWMAPWRLCFQYVTLPLSSPMTNFSVFWNAGFSLEYSGTCVGRLAPKIPRRLNFHTSKFPEKQKILLFQIISDAS